MTFTDQAGSVAGSVSRGELLGCKMRFKVLALVLMKIQVFWV